MNSPHLGRRALAVLAAGAIGVISLPVLAIPASAADVLGFEIDGDLIDNPAGGAADWNTRLSGPTLNDNFPSDTTVFSASSKEENLPSTWSFAGQAPSKSDIGNVYVDTDLVTGKIVVRLGWDRDNESGTDTYFIELNKLPNVSASIPNRSVGDLRFAIKEQGNEVIDLALVSTWSGSAWTNTVLNPTGFAYDINSVAVPLPAGWTSPNESGGLIPEEHFVETSFDLTTLIGLQPSCPPAFGTLNFRNATGNSGPNTPAGKIGDNLKDTIGGLSVPAPSTCGTVEIVKETVPSTSGEDFGFELVTDNASGIKDPAYTGPITLTTGADGTVSTLYTVAPGDYGFREALKTGWDLTNLVCVDPTDDSVTDLGLRIALFKVASQEKVTCTYTNTKRAKLTIEKVTRPGSADNPATPATGEVFNFASQTGAIGTFGLEDTQFRTTVNLLPNATYTVSEALTNPQLSAGWFTESITCDNGTTGTISSTGGSVSVDLQPGDDVKCTFTNTKNGVVEVAKQTDPANAPDQFQFSGDIGSFPLTDNGLVSTQVRPGQHVVTEAEKTGWTLTDVQCNDNNSVGNIANRTATYNVEAGETVRCTFTNTKLGQITVTKEINGTNQPFTFNSDGFTLTDTTLADGESASSTVGLLPGTYKVSEVLPTGWEDPQIVCSVTGGNGSGYQITGLETTVTLKAGDTVACTYTNTEKARLKIIKTTSPAGQGPFTFTDVDGNVTGLPTGLSDGESFTSDYLVGGTYNVEETIPAGWEIASIVCNDPDDGTTYDADAGTIAFDLDPGELVDCTVNNRAQGRIVLEKETDPLSEDGTFTYTQGGGITDFDDDSTWNSGTSGELSTVGGTDSWTSGFVTAGTYTISEDTLPAEWNLSDITCTDPDDGSQGQVAGDAKSGTATYDVDPGETVTCTFTNTKLGMITVTKETLPADSSETFDFTDVGIDWVSDPIDLGNGDSASSVPLPAGNYSITEIGVGGWDLTGLTCTSNQRDDFDGDLESATVDITLGKAEVVECTFTNTQRGNVVVEKLTDPAGLGPFDFTSDIDGFAPSLSDTETDSVEVKPGTYTVTEGEFAETVLSTIVCDDTNSSTPSSGDTGTRTATYNVEPGETVKCTFTNTRNGVDLTVSKTAVPTFTRVWVWEIVKESDATYNLLAGQSVDHDYTVDVTPTPVDGSWFVTGTITVTNLNGYDVTDVDVTDTVDNGGNCVVTSGTGLTVPANDSVEVDYTCTYAAEPSPLAGTNTAEATWDAAANYTPTGSAEGTAGFVFDDGTVGNPNEIDPVITVDDDKYDGDAGWTADRSAEQWTYTVNYPCSTDVADYTDGVYSYEVVNTATINETGANDDATVTVNCSIAVASKDAAGTYDERHEWDVEKSVDPETQDAFAGEDGDYTWTVTVTEEVFDEAFEVTGQIQVLNPSSEAVLNATVTDELDDGTVAVITGCTDGEFTAPDQLVVQPGDTATCDYTAAPSDASATKNVVTVVANGVTSTGEADLAWTSNVIRGQVELTDDQNPAFPITIDEGGEWTYDDSETCSTNPADYGETGSYTITDDNTAVISAGENELDSSSASAEVNCYAPIVTKDANTDFTRIWNWEIEKVEDAEYDLIAGEGVTHDYTVTVTPTPVDDQWAVSGTITVANPNPSADMVLTSLTDDAGGVVAEHDCDDLTVPAGGTLECNYTTGPQDSPDANPFGDTNTATAGFAGVDWTGTAAIEFADDPTSEVDPVITVDDDLYDGDAGWTADRSAEEWTYSTDYVCPDTNSAEYVDGLFTEQTINTATIIETEASDTATVTLNCADVVVEAVVIQPPLAKTGLGIPVNLLASVALAMLTVGLGMRFSARNRRETLGA